MNEKKNEKKLKNKMQTSQKVAFNTFVMYTKVLVTVGVSLYSTRLILCELGAEDFGIFNLIAGIVGMLAFLNTSVSLATQRYLAYTLGERDREHYEAVYCAAKKNGLYLGFLLLIIIEILGLFFLNKLNYAPERDVAVQIVFHCMVLSTFFSVWAIPYEAAIIANEDIYVISIIYIIESLLKLGIAMYLIYTPFDKLIVYGVLLVFVYISTNIYKKYYCRKYGVCSSVRSNNKGILKEMAKFSGWTSIEPLSTLFSVQGMAVLLNLFGGAVVNAAYGIANQVCGQMNYFSASLLSSITPQIIKSEGMNDRVRTIRLSKFACKLSFWLLSFFSVPLIIEMPFILRLWLTEVPEYTVLFCRLVLFSFIISQLAFALQSSISAVGKIKNYQISIGVIKLIVLPTTYILLKLGMPIYIAVLAFVVMELLNSLVRIFFAHKLLRLNVKDFLFSVTIRLLCSFAIIIGVLYCIKGFFYLGFHRLVIITVLNSALWIVLLKTLILTKDEFAKIKNVLISFCLKKINRTE